MTTPKVGNRIRLTEKGVKRVNRYAVVEYAPNAQLEGEIVGAYATLGGETYHAHVPNAAWEGDTGLNHLWAFDADEIEVISNDS